MDIDGVLSDFAEILAGVPQGSILGQLLFLIYINDFPNATDFSSFLFADDTSLLLSGKDFKILQDKAQAELDKVEDWFNANKMQINSKKTRFIIFNLPKTKRSDPFEIRLGGEKLCRVSEGSEEKSVHLVGVLLEEELSFVHHIASIKAKLSRANFVLARSRNILPLNIRILIYNSLVRSVLEFACVLYGASRKGVVDIIEKLQKKIVRNVKGVWSRAHTNNIFSELGIMKVRDMIEYNQIILGHGIWYKTLPENIRLDFEPIVSIERKTRAATNMNLKVPFCSKEIFKSAPCFTIPTAWNTVSVEFKKMPKIKSFKNKIQKNYLDKYKNEPECTRNDCYSCLGPLRRS